MIIQDHPSTLFVDCHFFKWLDGKEFDSYIDAVRAYRTQLDYQGLILRTDSTVTRATFDYWWRTQRLAVHGLPKLLADAAKARGLRNLNTVARLHDIDPLVAQENARIADAVKRGAGPLELNNILLQEF